MILTKDNIHVYGAKYYLNESCLSIEEFEEDLSKYKRVHQMVRKMSLGKKTNIRLLCNHVLSFTNNFETKAAKEILFFELHADEKSVLKTVLNYLGFLVPNEVADVRFHLETAKALKEMDN